MNFPARTFVLPQNERFRAEVLKHYNIAHIDNQILLSLYMNILLRAQASTLEIRKAIFGIVHGT